MIDFPSVCGFCVGGIWFRDGDCGCVSALTIGQTNVNCVQETRLTNTDPVCLQLELRIFNECLRMNQVQTFEETLKFKVYSKSLCFQLLDLIQL